MTKETNDKAAASGSSPDPVTADPANVLPALAEIIYQGTNASEVYGAICIAATLLVPGCDHTSLLIRRDGRYVTAGASDRIAEQIDNLERSTGEGPCLEAIDERSPQIEADLNSPSRWFNFAARVIAETPVRGAMGFRTLVAGRKIGALDLFSDSPNVFDIQAAGQAAVLASFASVAINAIDQGEDAANLRRALDSNREIGKAIGMLMLMHHISEEEAFDMLSRYSQDLSIKLADVARIIIDRRGQLDRRED